MRNLQNFRFPPLDWSNHHLYFPSFFTSNLQGDLVGKLGFESGVKMESGGLAKIFLNMHDV